MVDEDSDVFKKNQEKALWKKFYDEERDFYTEFGEDTSVKKLDSLTGKPRYIPDPKKPHGPDIPPVNVRYVAYVSDAGQFQRYGSYLNVLQAKYQQAAEYSGSFKKYPNRFPMLFKEVSYLSMSKVTGAVKSKALARDKKHLFLTLNPKSAKHGFEAERNEWHKFIQSLSEIGVGAFIKDDKHLIINTDEMYGAFNASLIQVRRQAGSSYKCRVCFDGKPSIDTYYGLILLDREVDIFNAPPRKVKSTSIEAKAQKIQLSYCLDGYTFWIKE